MCELTPEQRRVITFVDVANFFAELAEVEYTGDLTLHMIRGDIKRVSRADGRGQDVASSLD